jgi:hypothetical protein
LRIRSRRTSPFRSAPLSAGLASLPPLLLLLLLLSPAPARAQACCAAAGLVTPGRLRLHEDWAVGLQVRSRTVLGAFGEDGRYVANGAGDSEWDEEQDVFASARVWRGGQITVELPLIETRRGYPGGAQSEGGIGDVVVAARYDFVLAGERRVLPGLAVLASVVFPTGRASEESGGGSGLGSYQGTLGVDVEQTFGGVFAAVNAWATLEAPRHVGGVHESFAPLFTQLLAVGYAFANEISMGGFMTGMQQGDNRDQMTGRIAGSAQLMFTAGAALVMPWTDTWRFQGTVYDNLPFDDWGRNVLVGVGASASVMRIWL